MNKVKRRVASVPLLWVVLLLGVITPGVADASPTGQFELVYSSGRGGEVTYVKQDTPCPAGDVSSVWISFTDATNTVTHFFKGNTDTDGNWHVPLEGWEIPIPTSAAQGSGSLQGWCDPGTGPTMEFADRLYTITAPAPTTTVSQVVSAPGEVLTIQSTITCSENHGLMQDMSLVNGERNSLQSVWQPHYDGGPWKVDYPIPFLVEDQNGALQSPEGNYRVVYMCYGPDIRNQYFAPTYFSVRKLNQVGLGDSFSSGESVESFESGTATPGTNICHRSPKAYARLLEQRLKFNLGSKFAACAGARSQHISGTWSGINLNEPAQLDHLDTDTDLVTLSIGGNDMPFRDFAFACLAPQPTPCSGQARSDAIAGIANNVIPSVQSAMEALKGRLDALGSDAAVLVVGYPHSMDEAWHSSCPLTYQEIPAVREVVDLLNTAIKNEVQAVDGNFHFVSATEPSSPFKGHELCRNESDSAPDFFFYDENPFTPEEYTLHPNEQGQAAYADLVQGWLEQHMEVLN